MGGKNGYNYPLTQYQNSTDNFKLFMVIYISIQFTPAKLKNSHENRVNDYESESHGRLTRINAVVS